MCDKPEPPPEPPATTIADLAAMLAELERRMAEDEDRWKEDQKRAGGTLGPPGPVNDDPEAPF